MTSDTERTRAQEAAQPDIPPQKTSETLFEDATQKKRDALQLQLGSYDGPLDMLLDLARAQKVDLKEISMLALAEQYLSFLTEARRARLDIAADYLVMAAWLAYLKSRLLLPKAPQEEGPSGEEMAAYLAFQMERLAGLRRAAEDLLALPRLGEDFFARGEPERRIVSTRVEWTATQHDLLMAYARQRTKKEFTPLHMQRRSVIAVDQALIRLRRSLGESIGWDELSAYLPEEWRDERHFKSAMASTFVAALELAKHGQLTLKQDGAFAPLMVASKEVADAADETASEDRNPLAARLDEAASQRQPQAKKPERAPHRPAQKGGAA